MLKRMIPPPILPPQATEFERHAAHKCLVRQTVRSQAYIGLDGQWVKKCHAWAGHLVGSHQTGGRPKHAARKTFHGGDCSRKIPKDTDIANTGGTCLDGKTNCLGTATAMQFAAGADQKIGKMADQIWGFREKGFWEKKLPTLLRRCPPPPPPPFKVDCIPEFPTPVALGRGEGPYLNSPWRPLKPGKLRALKELLLGLRGGKGETLAERRAGGTLGMGHPEGFLLTPQPTPGAAPNPPTLLRPLKEFPFWTRLMTGSSFSTPP